MFEPTREPRLPKADLSGTESVALELQHEEQTARLPQNAQELIAATIDHGGVFEIIREEIKDVDDTVPPSGRMKDLLDEAEDRVDIFLRKEIKTGRRKKTTEHQPRPHVDQLIKFAQDETINGEAQALMHELQDRLYADVHGILLRFQAQAEKKLPPEHPLRQPQAIARALCYGNIDTAGGHHQKVQTIFGVYRHLQEQGRPFAALNLEAAEIPEKVSVVNPLDTKTQSGYWTLQKKLSAQYREGKDKDPTLSQLIFEHSERASGALFDAYEEVESRTDLKEEEKKKLKRSYEFLVVWTDEEASVFNRKMSDEELEFRAGLLYFGASDQKVEKGGDINKFAILFNAAETVKQYDRELFLRLTGVAPAHEQYKAGEVARSDLFGSVFQIAFYNSLQMRNADSYLEKIRGLTAVRVKQQEYYPRFSSGTDFDALEERLLQAQGVLSKDLIVDLEKAATEGRSAATTVAVDVPMWAMMQSWREAANIQKTLQTIEVGKSEKILTKLRNPSNVQGYIDLFNDLPEYMYESFSDEETRQRHNKLQGKSILEKSAIRLFPPRPGVKLIPAVKEAAAEGGARLYRETRPADFIALLQWMPDELVMTAQVNNALQERVKSQIYRFNSASDRPYVISTMGYDPYPRIVSEPEIREKHMHKREYPRLDSSGTAALLREMVDVENKNYDELITVLWETAPDEAVLDDDASEAGFFEFVKKLMADPNDTERAKKLIYLAAGHKEITDEQWTTWFDDCIKQKMSIPFLYPGSAKAAYEKILDTWRNILKTIPTSEILSGPASRFFSLQEVVGQYRVPEVRASYVKRDLERGEQLEEAVAARELRLQDDKLAIRLDQTFIGRNFDHYKPYAFFLADLSDQDHLKEIAILHNPVSAAVVEFRNSSVGEFVNRINTEILDLDNIMHLTAAQLNEFVHQLARDEAQLLLVEYFESRDAEIGYEVFNPFNPWQLEMLRLAEEFIPDDQNYQAAIYELEHKIPGQSFPTDWQKDVRFTHSSEQKPTKGKPYSYSMTEVGFLGPDDKILRRRPEFCWPRYTQDEQKRWHAEWLDVEKGESGEWQRFVEWSRFGVLENNFHGFNAGKAVPIPTSDTRGLYLIYREHTPNQPLKIMYGDGTVLSEINFEDGFAEDVCVLPNGDVAVIVVRESGTKLAMVSSGDSGLKLGTKKAFKAQLEIYYPADGSLKTWQELEEPGKKIIRLSADGKLLYSAGSDEPEPRESIIDFSRIRHDTGYIQPIDQSLGDGMKERNDVTKVERGKATNPEWRYLSGKTWDPTQRKYIEKYPANETGYDHRVEALTTDKYVIYSSDGALSHLPGKIEVFDRSSGELLWQTPASKRPSISIIDDSQIAISGYRQSNIDIYDLQSGSRIGTVSIGDAYMQRVIPFSDHRFLVEAANLDDIPKLLLIGEKEVA